MDSNDKTLRWKLNQVIFSEATSGTGENSSEQGWGGTERERTWKCSTVAHILGGDVLLGINNARKKTVKKKETLADKIFRSVPTI